MGTVEIFRYYDNYIYLVHDNSTALVIDPGSAQPVLSFLQENDLRLSSILITHNHGDHTGGVSTLKSETGCAVIGPKTWGVASAKDGEEIEIGGMQVKILAVPGHTGDHVAYYFPGMKSVFTGDTMFVAGCGRLFGGSAAELYNSLQKIAALGDEVKMYCGHDYTEENLRFALTVEPDNVTVQEKLKQVRDILSRGGNTVPSDIAEEKLTNVFLSAPSVKVFAELRRKKDMF